MFRYVEMLAKRVEARLSFQNRKRIRDFGRIEATPVVCEVYFRAKMSVLI
jgi:hypothetical protein